MTTTQTLTSVFVITKQYDVSESSKGWAELEVTDGGVPYVLAYQTREEAISKMRSMVPEGKSPLAYAGLRVEKRSNRDLFFVVS